jgi:hypothetical protein
MKDRIFRFGLTGLTFITSIFFGNWLMGGDQINVFFNKDYLKIIIFILSLITTPIVGFIVSSIIIGIYKYFDYKNVDFLPPSKEYEQEYLAKMYGIFSNIGSGISYSNDKYSITDYNEVLINHQLLFRKIDNEEAVLFTVRRMDQYWTQLNTIFSILAGMGIGIIMELQINGCINRTFLLYKFILFILIVIYIILGWQQGRKALLQVNDFEKKYILLYVNNDISKELLKKTRLRR